MYRKTLLSFLFFWVSVLAVQAQETKLHKQEVPAAIKEHIASHYPTASRIRYYREVYFDTIFVESEFRFRGEKYSLRFYNETLHEVEIYISFNEIPIQTQANIQSTLDSLFTRYRILYIQEVNPRTDLQYEVNVKGAREKSVDFYELFLDPTGGLLRINKVFIEPIPSQF
jgi:hypothetical protein